MYSYDRTASTHTATSRLESVWGRCLDVLETNTKAMHRQVDRFGGIQNAVQNGHDQTLKQQLHEMATMIRLVQRLLGESV